MLKTNRWEVHAGQVVAILGEENVFIQVHG